MEKWKNGILEYWNDGITSNQFLKPQIANNQLEIKN